MFEDLFKNLSEKGFLVQRYLFTMRGEEGFPPQLLILSTIKGWPDGGVGGGEQPSIHLQEPYIATGTIRHTRFHNLVYRLQYYTVYKWNGKHTENNKPIKGRSPQIQGVSNVEDIRNVYNVLRILILSTQKDLGYWNLQQEKRGENLLFYLFLSHKFKQNIKYFFLTGTVQKKKFS
jgi:hypothetical protein